MQTVWLKIFQNKINSCAPSEFYRGLFNTERKMIRWKQVVAGFDLDGGDK